jgi:hypothetical protein
VLTVVTIIVLAITAIPLTNRIGSKITRLHRLPPELAVDHQEEESHRRLQVALERGNQFEVQSAQEYG